MSDHEDDLKRGKKSSMGNITHSDGTYSGVSDFWGTANGSDGRTFVKDSFGNWSETTTNNSTVNTSYDANQYKPSGYVPISTSGGGGHSGLNFDGLFRLITLILTGFAGVVGVLIKKIDGNPGNYLLEMSIKLLKIIIAIIVVAVLYYLEKYLGPLVHEAQSPSLLLRWGVFLMSMVSLGGCLYIFWQALIIGFCHVYYLYLLICLIIGLVCLVIGRPLKLIHALYSYIVSLFSGKKESHDQEVMVERDVVLIKNPASDQIKEPINQGTVILKREKFKLID